MTGRCDELTQTVSKVHERDHGCDDGEQPRLIVAFDYNRPTAPALRISLVRTDQVMLGRGDLRRAARHGKRVELKIADDQMSRQHALMRRVTSGWELVDVGSKNGTVVNGETVARTVLADGDMIEVGSTLLVFREEGWHRGDVTDRDLACDSTTPAVFRSVTLEMERHAADLAKIAGASLPVLVLGETGTGKELVARAIHERSGRHGAFVPVNCGALPHNLIESELFGYRRGAFSGAYEDREGLIRQAEGGTLFLDEIAELPEQSQVALLRVLQEREVRPIGGSSPVTVDIRVVTATHQDLARRLADGTFRQDLYARLAGFEVTLPALRERREDLGTIIAALLPRLAGATATPERIRFHWQAARALFAYPFPLNVRELEQALRTATVLADGGEIRLEHLPRAIRCFSAGERPPSTRGPEDRVLRQQLVEALRHSRGNVTAVARTMGKAPIQVRRWCRRFGINVAAFRE